MGETKTPVFGVVGGTIGYPFRMIGQRVEMPAQLGKRHDRIDWRTVLDDVEVVCCEVHNTRAVRARDVSIADLPLARHCPIQDRSPRRNLIDSKRDVALEDRERLAYAVAGNAATNREKLLDEREHAFSVGFGER